MWSFFGSITFMFLVIKMELTVHNLLDASFVIPLILLMVFDIIRYLKMGRFNYKISNDSLKTIYM